MYAVATTLALLTAVISYVDANNINGIYTVNAGQHSPCGLACSHGTNSEYEVVKDVRV